MAGIKTWISAMRLRTLPLSLASIMMGGFLAYSHIKFSWLVLGLCLLTTVFLQVLSNLANDYGDAIAGADLGDRQGPQRAVSSGKISASAMKRGIIISAILSLISGISLLYFSNLDRNGFMIFLALGLLAILGAITYTVGKRPYGYVGLGDLSVFIFFGWVGVMGTYYLLTGELSASVLLPASSCSFLSVAVLNVNNIRDIESDKKAGKYSIPVRIGRPMAVRYHQVLLILAVLCIVLYIMLNFRNYWQYLVLAAIPLFVINAQAVQRKKRADLLDPYLKQLALSTLVFVLLFGVGQVLSL